MDRYSHRNDVFSRGLRRTSSVVTVQPLAADNQPVEADAVTADQRFIHLLKGRNYSDIKTFLDAMPEATLKTFLKTPIEHGSKFYFPLDLVTYIYSQATENPTHGDVVKVKDFLFSKGARSAAFPNSPILRDLYMILGLPLNELKTIEAMRESTDIEITDYEITADEITEKKNALKELIKVRFDSLKTAVTSLDDEALSSETRLDVPSGVDDDVQSGLFLGKLLSIYQVNDQCMKGLNIKSIYEGLQQQLKNSGTDSLQSRLLKWVDNRQNNPLNLNPLTGSSHDRFRGLMKECASLISSLEEVVVTLFRDKLDRDYALPVMQFIYPQLLPESDSKNVLIDMLPLWSTNRFPANVTFYTFLDKLLTYKDMESRLFEAVGLFFDVANKENMKSLFEFYLTIDNPWKNGDLTWTLSYYKAVMTPRDLKMTRRIHAFLDQTPSLKHAKLPSALCKSGFPSVDLNPCERNSLNIELVAAGCAVTAACSSPGIGQTLCYTIAKCVAIGGAAGLSWAELCQFNHDDPSVSGQLRDHYCPTCCEKGCCCSSPSKND